MGVNKNSDEFDYVDETYKVGQLWSYDNRPEDNDSTILILKIEKWNTDIIIHTSIFEINMNVNGCEKMEIKHQPFSKNAFGNSVTKLISSENRIPNFDESYEDWKELYEDDMISLNDSTVKELVEKICKTMALM